MLARTPRDLGLMIREQRRKLRLEQRQLAERVGVSRQWIIDVEKGKPRVPLELVLRTLAALELELDVTLKKKRVAADAPELELNKMPGARPTQGKAPGELAVLLNGVPIGQVTRDRRQRLLFAYEPAWREAEHAVPLSLSMPLAASEHGAEPIEAFMWGLLPDDERVLGRWARQFHVSARNPMALLAHVGQDCAGAVQFVTPERSAELSGPGPAQVQWLNDHDVAARLRALRADPSAWRSASDTGQFSLAGGQAKTALFWRKGRWGVPQGRTPTTHILKPPVAGFDGHAQNEHFCLVLARALGLPTASSRVMHFEDEPAIVVTRYDRYITSATETDREKQEPPPVLRLHQEDLCQALALPPTRKYQKDGGPAPRQIVALLRAHSSNAAEDVATFLDALIFNWLTAGTDGHAKNYSLLLGARAQVRLAPLYGLSSALPYPSVDQRRLTLAMEIGDTYRVHEVSAREFKLLARALELDERHVLERAAELAARTANLLPTTYERERASGLAHPIMERLVEGLREHVTRCQRGLAAGR